MRTTRHHLSGVRIGGTLNCIAGSFDLLILNSAVVKGMFVWTKVKNPNVAELDLRNASVGSLADDEKSWPAKGHLRLDGIQYERISGSPLKENFVQQSDDVPQKERVVDSPMDATTRLRWLDRQAQFNPRPYRQLATVLREMGDDDGAKEVLFELEGRAR
jgi:hypothetical protein